MFNMVDFLVLFQLRRFSGLILKNSSIDLVLLYVYSVTDY